jgi:hypothetical protein
LGSSAWACMRFCYLRLNISRNDFLDAIFFPFFRFFFAVMDFFPPLSSPSRGVLRMIYANEGAFLQNWRRVAASG